MVLLDVKYIFYFVDILLRREGYNFKRTTIFVLKIAYNRKVVNGNSILAPADTWLLYPTVTRKEAHAVPVLHKKIDDLAAESRTAGNERFHEYLVKPRFNRAPQDS
jgi:hypothetical protein